MNQTWEHDVEYSRNVFSDMNGCLYVLFCLLLGSFGVLAAWVGYLAHRLATE